MKKAGLSGVLILLAAAANAQTPPLQQNHLLGSGAYSAWPPAGYVDTGIDWTQLKACLLGVPSALCPMGKTLAPTPTLVVSTAASTTKVTNDYNFGLVEVTAGGPVTITWTCDGIMQGFVVKDMTGLDGANPITLSPSTGAVDGQSSFVMNKSVPGTPPYDFRLVLCDANKLSILN